MLVLVGIGAVLVLAGALLGPETKGIDFTADEPETATAGHAASAA